MTNKEKGHWLTQEKTIRKLWWIFSAVLALTVMAQLVWYAKGYFTVDGWLGFGAVYGFLSCLLMVLFAKGLGVLLKRPNHYYSERDTEQDVKRPQRFTVKSNDDD